MEEKESPNQFAVADLPDDLIVEILSRLPAGPLCRCKCVSRSWRALISDPAHRARLAQTLSGFFVFSRPHSAAAPSSWSFVATRQSPPLQGEGEGGAPLVDTALSFLPPSHGEIEMLDSCNGLLLLRCCSSDQRHPFYVVCNPATGEWVALPQPSHAPGQKVDAQGYGIMTCNAALGFDPAVSSYFYVFQFMEEEIVEELVVREVEIYSSETGTWVLRQSGWDHLVFFAGQKTYFKGFLYLTSCFHETIAAVDTKGQTWRVTDVREDPVRSNICHFVGHSQGRLLYIFEDWSRESMSIHVLEDQANKEGTVNHSVIRMDLLGATKPEKWGMQLQTIAFHPDGNLIFFYERPSDRFMCYDMNRKDVHDICTVGGDLFLPYVPFYSRVLVSPK
ncbi:unnamed protein product [Urochloa humidicola]